LGSAQLVSDPSLIHQVQSYCPGYWSPCLGSGLNLKKLFGINPGTQDFLGSPFSIHGIFNIGAF
jgi:hypothetical protein